MPTTVSAIAFIASAILARVSVAVQTTYINGNWYYGLASCGGKPFTPFNFSANVCSVLDTDDLQVQFKGLSLRLNQPDASRATAKLVVFTDNACGGQPTEWGTVADGACQMSYWSTKYTFDTNFTIWAK